MTSKPRIKAQRQPRGGEKGLGNVLCVFEGQPGVGSWGCVNIGVCMELDVHPSPPKSMSLSYSGNLRIALYGESVPLRILR